MRLIDADALLETLNDNDINDWFSKDFLFEAITNAPTVQREGWVSVPFDLLDSFPEINLGNYGDEEVRNLNNWGIELVNSAAPKE